MPQSRHPSEQEMHVFLALVTISEKSDNGSTIRNGGQTVNTFCFAEPPGELKRQRSVQVRLLVWKYDLGS